MSWWRGPDQRPDSWPVLPSEACAPGLTSSLCELMTPPAPRVSRGFDEDKVGHVKRTRVLESGSWVPCRVLVQENAVQ